MAQLQARPRSRLRSGTTCALAATALLLAACGGGGTASSRICARAGRAVARGGARRKDLPRSVALGVGPAVVRVVPRPGVRPLAAERPGGAIRRRQTSICRARARRPASAISPRTRPSSSPPTARRPAASSGTAAPARSPSRRPSRSSIRSRWPTPTRRAVVAKLAAARLCRPTSGSCTATTSSATSKAPTCACRSRSSSTSARTSSSTPTAASTTPSCAAARR